MAFRDHLSYAERISDEVSLVHGIWELSSNRSHPNLLFENVKEAPGQRVSVNMLTRDRLCEAIGIQPEVYIDTLAWAMKNPGTPELVSPAESPVYDNMQEKVDLHSIAIPHHWPQDRGRYMSASVIIAEVNGQRNMSFQAISTR